MAMEATVRDAIDLERYPLHDPAGAAYRALVARCQAGLAETGASVLEGFVKPDHLPRAVAEVAPNLGEAFYKTKQHSPYLVADDPAFPADHPRNRKQTTNSATLGYPFIPRDSLLNGIYGWAPFVGFVAEVLGYPRLYPYADPLAPVNVLVYNEGCQTGWHFDNSTFTLTLLLQEGEGGAGFEYAPFIRSDAAENNGANSYDAVEAVLEERSDQVQELRQPAGALVLFKGSRTLHRVTPVTGPRPRLVGVFTYSPEAGTELNPHTRMTFYGRVA